MLLRWVLALAGQDPTGGGGPHPVLWPLGIAVEGPTSAVGDDVMVATEQEHRFDVGGATVLPTRLMMRVAPAGRCVTAWEHTPAVA